MQWQADADLAGIRDVGLLDKLSAREREECVALWEQVAAALDRVNAEME